VSAATDLVDTETITFAGAALTKEHHDREHPADRRRDERGTPRSARAEPRPRRSEELDVPGADGANHEKRDPNREA
jgi:hypothetical protein